MRLADARGAFQEAQLGGQHRVVGNVVHELVALLERHVVDLRPRLHPLELEVQPAILPAAAPTRTSPVADTSFHPLPFST